VDNSNSSLDWSSLREQAGPTAAAAAGCSGGCSNADQQQPSTARSAAFILMQIPML
jgi:hypothetical protein